MARIRSIKPDFWTSEQVMECSANARLLFIGMWNFADDCGRLSLAPKTIKAQIFPGDNLTSESILGMIEELLKSGLLLKYEVDGKEFLQVTGWQHQRIDKPQPAKFPAPRNGFSKSVPGMVATEGMGEERKVEEGNGKEGNKLKSSKQEARAAVSNSEKVLRSDLMEIFGPSKCPDLSRAGVWLGKGYSAGMIVEVVRELLARTPNIASLNYFDAKIEERHAKRAATPSERAAGVSPENMDWALGHFAKGGHWARSAGPEPGQPGCRATVEMLAKHGLGLDGQKLRADA